MNAFKKFFSHNRPPFHIHLSSLTGLDYSYITEGIYIGTNQCCTIGISDVLKKEGIDCDISLEEIRLDQPFGVSAYVWIPVHDHGIPTKDQLFFGIHTLETLIQQNKKVYLHCKNGHGRSSTLVTGYLMKTNHLNYDDAFRIIKKQRPGAHMQENQISFLKSLETDLQK